MIKYVMLSFLMGFVISTTCAQESPFERFSFLLGSWEGTGSGFSASKSAINSKFEMALNKNFIEVSNHSEFKSAPQQTQGEIHEDWGMISFDKDRKVYVFRQFHNEGYYNQYILCDSLSSENSLVFESEYIENFVPGGRARFTINKISDNEIETLFDVGFPGKELACFGINRLKKK